ncbi:hypothetical protein ACO1O0_002407 [Amphichorda felina]
MNIAQPISSDVESVEFTFLSPKEIRAISVKRIENDNTFDNLLNPVPGGLYDPALGSWGDSPYICKLRLLQYGLINEAHIVDCIGENDVGLSLNELGLESYESEAEEEGNSSVDNVTRARDKYVEDSLRSNRTRRSEVKRGKHEGATEMRREVIKSFLAELTKTRKCASCGGISPVYRKDRFVKIFEKALSDKEKAKMAQKNMKRNDALARIYQTQAKRKSDGYSSDEGVADVESPTAEKPEVHTVDAEQDITMPDVEESMESAPQRYISPMEVRARLTELFEREQELIFLLYNTRPATRNSSKVTPEMFFLTHILVPPNRYRPEARTGDSSIAEAQQNSLYKNILRFCGRIALIHKALSEQRGDISQLHQACAELQDAVNSLIDKDKNPVQGAAAARNEDGIKQKLEKKEGLFRKNMMGKRVNYAARSVISPDPNLETNEIGVPPVFAKKLTYPEPVTSHNFRDMQQAVINGVDKWPGAFAIENENGQIVSLRNKPVDDRISLANQLLAPSSNNAAKTKNKKVYRHLTNGDVVLMNRQPTLHKPSIMGHRVRVLAGEKTIRMHYANCNTYNADFDGDEMNMHFPQNEVARAEALQIADTDHQYLSATAGKPLRGLIQDHISVSVALCNRDTFFNRGDYHQLVYSALRPESGHILGERIQLVPPAIIKPVPRWTGKQIITTILKNMQPLNCGGLFMQGESQVKGIQWGSNSEEGTVLIQNGELITGILDKAQIGPSSGGLIHSVHEIYGPAVAGKLLSSLGRLLTRYLNVRAFSCGMDDLKLTKEGEIARRKELCAANDVGLGVASGYVSVEDCKLDEDPLLLERLEEVLRDDNKQEGLDLLMNAKTSKITDAIQSACMPSGLEKPFPKNQMQAMTTSGAKGSKVNASLISCNLGQQVLEGRRVPLMVSGKSLPCFKPFETHARAGGYIVQRFLTGLRPQEYYFHHMAGREGLIDTAVKTSRSGYLQRCVIKGMEGLTVAYDTTVRDADGSMIQFLYGEDGLDVTKEKYLSDFGFVLQNVTSEAAQLRYDPKVGERLSTNREDITKYMKKAIKHSHPRDPQARDPILNLFNPATNAFATSEKFFEAMTTYVKENKDGLVLDKTDKSKNKSRAALNRKNAEMLFAMKYLQSLVEPGEAVGIVAGQSVGEPSTQMTLNTFHLAGHSAKNVTLGIPRLREILMTASKSISTPAMSLYPITELSKEDAEVFSKSISILPLGYVLDSASVQERVGRGKGYATAKMYTVKLNFFPSEEYSQTYAITVDDVMSTVERKFLPNLVTLIKRELRKRKNEAMTAADKIGVKAGVVETATPIVRPERGEDEDDDDENGDGDATSAKQRANRGEAVSYGPNDDEDDTVQQTLDRADRMADDTDDEGIGGSPPPRDLQARRDEGDRNDDVEDGEDEATLSAQARRDRIFQKHGEASGFSCDDKGGAWCTMNLEYPGSTPKLLMLNLVQDAVKKTVIQQLPGVGTCTLVDENDGPVIHTEGVNLRAMQKYSDFIDPHRISTNDIAAVLEVYGVEAARKTIANELGGVFGSHGIKVDNRHLNLIADYMTRNGDFTPFNRMGLRGNVSPFTKMSFETTLAFLKDAVLDGDWDDLTTPSSRLVLGRLGKVGTGGFDVLTQLPTHYDELMA